VYTFSTWQKRSHQKSSLFLRIIDRLLSIVRHASSFWRQSNSVDMLAVYNCHFTDLLVIAPALWLRRKRFPLVVQLEDLCGARAFNSGWKQPLERLATAMLLSRASLLLVPSSGMFGALPSRWRFFPKASGLFPPSLSSTFLVAVAYRPEPFSRVRLRMVYAGGHGAEKGTDLLVKAFRAAGNPRLELHLYGGPYPLEFAEIQGVVVHGSASAEELAMAYASADICINPHQKIRQLSHVYPCKNIEILASGALPLMSKYCHADTFLVPKECLFSDVIELTQILKKPEEIYAVVKPGIEFLRERMRQDFCEDVINQPLKSLILNALH
jgi:glycosyltransferase involved in cell wall biosynthesis